MQKSFDLVNGTWVVLLVSHYQLHYYVMWKRF